jgi:ADP-ribose pyrophosphatase
LSGEPAEPRSSRTIFSGRVLEVRLESWPAGEREVVRHPGACAIVAITSSQDVLLVRQFREAVRRELLEIPAGIRDVAGESAATCAARELMEETGYRASTIEPLGSVLTSPGFADERIDLFLARAADEPEAAAQEDGVEVVRLPYRDALRAIEDGRIEDAKTIAALLMARERVLGPDPRPPRAAPPSDLDA